VSCAGESLPSDEAGCEEAVDRQYRWEPGEHAQVHSGKTNWAFSEGGPAYGRGVAEGLGINVEHLVPQEPVLASD
jgi:hypothetical protein